MIYKRIKVPFYSQILHIIISDDVEKEISEIKKKFELDAQHFNFSGYSERIGQHHLLLINNKHLKNEIDVVETVCHEAFHISNFIMKRIGIKPDVNNDEAQAYLLGWIVEQTMIVIKKNK